MVTDSTELKQYLFGHASERTMKRARTIFDKLNYKSTLIQKGIMYSLLFYFSSQREYDECIEKYNNRDNKRMYQKMRLNKENRFVVLAQWRKDHPEETKIKQLQRKKKSLQQPLKRLRQKDYYSKNKKQTNERSKEWAQKNKEKARDASKRYKEKNRDKVNARCKKYYAAHKDEIIRKTRERRAKQKK